jgi:hypothetical protein
MVIARSNTTTLDFLGPWTAIALVTATASITLPGASPSKVNITTHDDVITFGGFIQNGAGLADVTDLSFEILMDPDDAQHQAMLADMAARTTRDYRITFPSITRKWGVRGQIGMASSGDGTNYLRTTCTVLANVIRFNVHDFQALTGYSGPASPHAIRGRSLTGPAIW